MFLPGGNREEPCLERNLADKGYRQSPHVGVKSGMLEIHLPDHTDGELGGDKDRVQEVRRGSAYLSLWSRAAEGVEEKGHS